MRIDLSTLLVLFLALGSASRGDDFPTPYNSEKDPGQPLPPAEAVKALSLPPGFRATLFAAEPEVRNPIGMAWDSKGRLWVAENYTYAERGVRFDLRLRDRVLILDDTDGDGKADKRLVFTDSVQKLTSVEVGRGGAWLLCPPQLLFVADRDGNDVPDGPAEVVLDGFTIPPENYHNLVNGLKWGPDGWLYGRCGASAPGRIGRPGTPDAQRVPLNGGLWRYHPGLGAFEVMAHGTTNPWGHDWNAVGEAFFINTVNGHLWHAVAGMHFVRPHTLDPNPSVYLPIDHHADHWHWDTAKDWSDSRNPTAEHDRGGGGHAHSGMMIYQGNQWPESYRGKLLTVNLHGRRLNVDRLEREGTGYIGRHEPDMIRSRDPWFRGIEVGAGPDGGVYILDWSDGGECHESTGVHRTSGRIYKISYGEMTKPARLDLSRVEDSVLIQTAIEADETTVRLARGVLSERATNGAINKSLVEALKARLHRSTKPVETLRVLWLLRALGATDEPLLIGLLAHSEESVRAWAIRLLTDQWPLDDIMSKRLRLDVRPSPQVSKALIDLARKDPSGLVRLLLASTLQRLPLDQRASLAGPLLERAEDAQDHNQPLLIWFGLIPLADSDPASVAKLAVASRMPLTRKEMARRLIEGIESHPEPVALLTTAIVDQDVELQRDILLGVSEGLRGIRKATRPKGWDELVKKSADSPVLKQLIRELSVVFGDGRALEEVRKLALDDKAPLDVRKSALRSLIDSRPPDLRTTCQRLLKVRFLNAIAARGLALFDDPAVGAELVTNYRTFHPSERPAILDTLVSRPSFARALVEGMAKGKIAPTELSAFQARQVRSLNDVVLSQRLAEVWGEVRDSAPQKRAAIDGLKSRLSVKELALGEPGRGRTLFAKLCASCHTLYGQGGQIGPDLTGSGRDNIDYLLENMLDPAATVTADYRMTVVAMKDGRVLNGIVKSKNERSLSLQTQTELIPLAVDEIEEQRTTTASLMPDGLIDPLTPIEVRDLFSYLMGRVQVPLAP